MREENPKLDHDDDGNQAMGLAILLTVQGALWLALGLGIGRLLWGPV